MAEREIDGRRRHGFYGRENNVPCRGCAWLILASPFSRVFRALAESNIGDCAKRHMTTGVDYCVRQVHLSRSSEIWCSLAELLAAMDCGRSLFIFGAKAPLDVDRVNEHWL